MSDAQTKTRTKILVTTLGGLAIVLTGILLVDGPLPQDTTYYLLADRRTFLMLPNFFDMVSSLPFAVVGMLGLSLFNRKNQLRRSLSWLIFFVSLLWVTLGSLYFHWQPNNASLFWDRLPMSVSFMSLFAALYFDHIDSRHEKLLLLLAVSAGLASVVYWRITDDLRCYAIIQFGALVAIPVILLQSRKRRADGHFLLHGLLLYMLAKLFEVNDHAIFKLTGLSVSGHTIKHLLAAGACFCIYRMLKKRTTIAS